MYHLKKLAAELRGVDAKIVSVRGENFTDEWLCESIIIDYTDDATEDDIAEVNAVLAAHTPEDDSEELRLLGRKELYRQWVIAVRDYETALQHWDSLTQAQLKSVIKRNVQVNLALLRFLKHLLF